MDWTAWQQRWDAQQQAYLPDREERFTAVLDAVEAACGRAPRVLDLAGGTGSITRRVLARFPAATSTVLDVDAALLAIAPRHLRRRPPRAGVLRRPGNPRLARTAR